jgi:hypothetical protein
LDRLPIAVDDHLSQPTTTILRKYVP